MTVLVLSVIAHIITATVVVCEDPLKVPMMSHVPAVNEILAPVISA
jgi:hypothetical protein